MDNSKSLVVGEKLTDRVLALNEMKLVGDNYSMALSCRDGKYNAIMSVERFSDSMKDLIGGAVSINGMVIISDDSMEPVIKVKSMAKADTGSYKPADLFNTITDEKIDMYKANIKALISQIPDEEYRNLVNVCLSENILDRMAILPANLRFARIRGGCLSATVKVSKMATQSAVQFNKLQDGITPFVIDWSLLISASLLTFFGIPFYLTDEPWKKTPSAVNRGYLSILQSAIENCLKDVTIDQNKVDLLLNVLASTMNIGVEPTTSEGIILSSTYIMCKRLETHGAALLNHEKGDDTELYFFDKWSRKYVYTGKETPDATKPA